MIPYEILLTENVIADVEETNRFENEKHVGLGRRFLTHFEAEVKTIGDNPHIYSIRYSGIRCFLIRKFPFLIHLRIDELTKTVIVLAVFSTDQKPRWEE